MALDRPLKSRQAIFYVSTKWWTDVCFLSFFSAVRVRGGRALNLFRHGWRAGQQRRRAGSRQSSQRGLAETLHRSGDAAAEVSAPGGQNPRAAGREGEREKSSLMQVFYFFCFGFFFLIRIRVFLGPSRGESSLGSAGRIAEFKASSSLPW